MVNLNAEVKPATRPKRPTLKTVAEACGLAVTTVSRALNDGEDIALKKRERVKRIAAELGYVPDRAGRGLRTGRSHVLGLVLAPHARISGYTAAIIAGLGDVCRANGYELLITPEDPDADALTTVQSLVENRRADGVIISRIAPQDVRVRYLLESGFPFVTHGQTELATAHAFVDFDNQAFTQYAARHLAERGRKRLQLVGAPTHLTYGVQMRTGFLRSVAQSGIDAIDPTDTLSIETPLPDIRAKMRALLRDPSRPDGVVCGGDLPALAVLGAIHDSGLVPGVDVDVFAKQTSDALDHVYPVIDTCFEDIAQTGRQLGEVLLKSVEGATPPAELTHIIAPDYRLRMQPLTSGSEHHG
ncbi:MAG: LacI family transcriptional regulator [Pseudomonadota bacterium]